MVLTMPSMVGAMVLTMPSMVGTMVFTMIMWAVILGSRAVVRVMVWSWSEWRERRAVVMVWPRSEWWGWRRTIRDWAIRRRLGTMVDMVKSRSVWWGRWRWW